MQTGIIELIQIIIRLLFFFLNMVLRNDPKCQHAVIGCCQEDVDLFLRSMFFFRQMWFSEEIEEIFSSWNSLISVSESEIFFGSFPFATFCKDLTCWCQLSWSLSPLSRSFTWSLAPFFSLTPLSTISLSHCMSVTVYLAVFFSF